MYKIKFGFFPPVTLSHARVTIRPKNPEATRGGLPPALVLPEPGPPPAGSAGAHGPRPSRESGWLQTGSPGVEPVAKAPDEHSTFLSVLRPGDGHCLCLSCVSPVLRRKGTGRDAGTGPAEPPEEPASHSAAFAVLSRPASAWTDLAVGPLRENWAGFSFRFVLCPESLAL